MPETNMHPEFSADTYRRAARRFYASIPLYLAVPVAFWLVLQAFGAPMQWAAFGLGATGWTIALFLRGPLSVLVKKMPKQRATTIVAAASGPFEEGVRVAVLLSTALSYPWAISLGQGWAAVEVVFTLINGVVLSLLLQRTDEKAMQVKEILQAQGSVNLSPLWGVAERVAASAFHIGATLIIASNPWLVVLMMPVHTGFNLSAMHLVKKSIPVAEAFMGIVGVIAMVLGLLALHIR